jgi:hypothetical protein
MPPDYDSLELPAAVVAAGREHTYCALAFDGSLLQALAHQFDAEPDARDQVLAAVNASGLALEFAGEHRGDLEVVRVAVAQDPGALAFAAPPAVRLPARSPLPAHRVPSLCLCLSLPRAAGGASSSVVSLMPGCWLVLAVAGCHRFCVVAGGAVGCRPVEPVGDNLLAHSTRSPGSNPGGTCGGQSFGTLNTLTRFKSRRNLWGTIFWHTQHAHQVQILAEPGGDNLLAHSTRSPHSTRSSGSNPGGTLLLGGVCAYSRSARYACLLCAQVWLRAGPWHI